jgi:holo-[acyl-carrier protein] synthase
MIYGIGIDIQSIAQIDEIFERQKDRFLKKIFTVEEITYCKRSRVSGQHFAARWAVKEAFFKALGTGIIGGYTFHDVEICKKASGQPYITLSGKALEECNRLCLRSFVSISHSDEYAVGQVILSYENDDEDF